MISRPTTLPHSTVGLRWRTAWREALILTLVITGVLAVTGIPALFATLTAPADRQFMGVILNVPDTAQYFGWAHAFKQAILIENTLTPERGQALFFNLFWFAVGRAGSLLGLEAPAFFQAARLVAGTVMLLALYWFVGLFSASARERWTTFLMIGLGGGLGWLLVIYKQFAEWLPLPLLVYVVEPNSLLTIMAFPHQAMATGLLVIILGLTILAFERTAWHLAGLAGLLTLVLGLQHGYDLLHVYAFVGPLTAILTLRHGWRWRPFFLGLTIGAPSLPAAIYLAWMTRADPIWRGVLAQYGNAGVYTPAPSLLPIVFGLPFILLLTYQPDPESDRSTSIRELLLRLWLGIGLLLMYVPTDFQIKMLAGWQIPLGIITARIWLARVAPPLHHWLARRWWSARTRPALVRASLAALVVVAVIPVNLYLVAWRVVDLARHDAPYYLYRDEIASLQWLAGRSGPDQIVLSSLNLGQYLPGQTNARPYLAHWAQTLSYFRRREAVERFYGDRFSESDRLKFLRDQGIRYVIFGRQERALGQYQPANSTFLRRVFSAGQTVIYEVVD